MIREMLGGLKSAAHVALPRRDRDAPASNGGNTSLQPLPTLKESRRQLCAMKTSTSTCLVVRGSSSGAQLRHTPAALDQAISLGRRTGRAGEGSNGQHARRACSRRGARGRLHTSQHSSGARGNQPVRPGRRRSPHRPAAPCCNEAGEGRAGQCRAGTGMPVSQGPAAVVDRQQRERSSAAPGAAPVRTWQCGTGQQRAGGKRREHTIALQHEAQRLERTAKKKKKKKNGLLTPR